MTFNFEEFTRRGSGSSSGNYLASLYTKRNRVQILSKWVKGGFDISLSYALLFDKDKQIIGLKPSQEYYAAKVKSNVRAGIHSISIAAFLKHHKIEGIFKWAEIEQVDGIWILPLDAGRIE